MEKQNTRRPQRELRDFFDGNLAYLVAMLLLVGGSIIIGISNANFNISAIIVELFAIAVPAVFFASRSNRGVKGFLRIKVLRPWDFLLIIGVFLTAYPVGIFLNYLVMMALMRIGTVTPPNIPVPNGTGEFIMQLASIAGSAALCEELLFRGFIMRAYEGFGWKKAILISAGLFSALHLSIQNMAATFYLGLLLGFVVYLTDSIFAGMTGHFLNNSIAVVLNMTLQKTIGASGVEMKAPEVMPTAGQMLVGSIFLGIFAIFMAATQVGLLFILHERSLNRKKTTVAKDDFIGPIQEVRPFGIRELWPLAPAAVIFLIFIIVDILKLVYGESFRLFS